MIFGLGIVLLLVPLSEIPERIISGVLGVSLLVYVGADWWASRRIGKWLEPLLIGLLVVAAFVLPPDPLPGVALLLLLVPYGSDLWGVLRREHAEYVAERERLP